MTVYLTGDTHGHFERIARFCQAYDLGKDDIVIILGDAGVNYYGQGSARDLASREALGCLAPTFFCLQGNHEMRPQSVGTYRETEWHGGTAFVEDEWPNILFAKDGELYDLDGTRAFVVGGAYSVDKNLRIAIGWHWFPDEQPSDEVKRHVEERLDAIGWDVDVMLTHTCPMDFRPIEAFVAGVKGSAVDTSTEEWLQSIEQRLTYKRWYFGHFHTKKRTERYQVMFDDWDVLWPNSREFDPADYKGWALADRRSFAKMAEDLQARIEDVEEWFNEDGIARTADDGEPICREQRVGLFVAKHFRASSFEDFEYGQCDQCRRWYHKSKLRNKHIEGCPEEDQPFICPDCLNGVDR